MPTEDTMGKTQVALEEEIYLFACIVSALPHDSTEVLLWLFEF